MESPNRKLTVWMSSADCILLVSGRTAYGERKAQYTEVRLSSHVQDVTIPWVSPVPERCVMALQVWKPPWMAGNAHGLPLPSLEG